VKKLKEFDVLEVDLDGTTGMGSSFLDESFGGLIFAEGMSQDEFKRRIRIKSELDSSYVITVEESVRRASMPQNAG
jgi:hypothetical protein